MERREAIRWLLTASVVVPVVEAIVVAFIPIAAIAVVVAPVVKHRFKRREACRR